MIAKAVSRARKAHRGFGLRVCLGLSLAAGSTLSAASAFAQSSSDSATAQALFDGAKKLMKAGDYSDACPKLEESQRIDAHSGTALNLADCYERTGRLASAWSTFLEAATLAKASGNAARERVASERAAALVPRLSNLLISAPHASTTPELVITRDSEVVGAAQLGLPLPMDAGEHVIAARAPGRKPWQTRVTVEHSASTATVAVPELERETALVPAQTSVGGSVPANAPAMINSVHQPSRIDGGVIAGGVVTSVLVIGTVVTSVLYHSKLSDYDSANHLDNNDKAAADLRSQVHTMGALNLALLGGAVVAAGVTVVLWATASAHESAASAHVELRGLLAPGMAGVSLGAKL
jgi:tetratricopeptide (TPR) repeat protein